MKKMLCLLAFVMMLVSCSQEGDTITNITNVVYKDAEEESQNFISEALLVYDGRKRTDEFSDRMYVRFYDGNKYIPYVSVQYYLVHFMKFALKDSSYSNHKYKYNSMVDKKKFSMIVDSENDTIYCPEWAHFLERDLKDNPPEGDTLEKVFEKILSYTEFYYGQKAITFDLRKYGFKIYGGTDDAYIPLCILNNLFSCYEFANYVFNGNGVYYVDMTGAYEYESFLSGSLYVDEKGNRKERPKELVNASYNLLCFTHDYLYGQPGYYGFADTEKKGYADANIVAKMDSLGFDDLLSTYDPEVKAQLLSSSYADYMAGLISLFYYTYGDLHASPIFYPNYLIANMADIRNSGIKKSAKWDRTNDPTLSQLREKAGKHDEQLELLAGGKTAVIRFDSFKNNVEKWAAYVAVEHEAEPDPSLVEIPDDTNFFIYKSFYALLNDEAYKDVKNVIFDVSNNGGGIESALHYLNAYILGSRIDYCMNVPIGSEFRRHFVEADLNLDCKMDEKDTAYRERIKSRFKFAVLTSFHSFSCGNIFPCACADAGIPIIGERSGGGSCAVGVAATADGLPYRYSKGRRESHADGTSFESGAPITKELPYEKFYDDAALQAVMDDLMTEKPIEL